MSVEAEVFTRDFWIMAFARSLSVGSLAAVGVLGSAQVRFLGDAPWYGTLTAAVISGVLLLGGLVGGATVRYIAPGSPETTKAAIASLRATGPSGRHAKSDDDQGN